MSFIIHNAPISHASGTHQLEVEIEGDEAVIRFGASFTLRMSETQVDALREVLHDTSRELCIRRRDVAGASSSAQTAESQMVQAGIDAREKIKAKRRVGKSEQKSIDIWDPQDPVNW